MAESRLDTRPSAFRGSGTECGPCCLSASLLCRFSEPCDCCSAPRDYSGDLYLASPRTACGPQFPSLFYMFSLWALPHIHSNSNYLQGACYCLAPPGFWKKYKASSDQSCSQSTREKRNAPQIMTLNCNKCHNRGASSMLWRHRDVTGAVRNDCRSWGNMAKASEK